MMNLYVDVQAKLRTEFRNYGANVVVVARNQDDNGDATSLPRDAISKIESALGPKTLAVPFAYAVARTNDGRSVAVVGTDFTRARQLNHWWNVTRWPTAAQPHVLDLNASGQSVTSPSIENAAPRGR